MPFRRRKKKNAHISDCSLPSYAFVAPVQESKKGPLAPPVLVASVEKAADLAKRELTNTGRITPKALFVYDGQTPLSDPRITIVSLAWRNEFQKDVLWRKIRDKALQEDAQAVVVTEIGPTGKRGLLTLSGMTREMEITASVDYAFDGGTKTIGRWEFRWLNEMSCDTS